MVGPSITGQRRTTLNARLRAAVVVTVAASGALVAVQAGGSALAVAGGGLLGAVVGYTVVRYLAVLGRQARATESRRRRGVDNHDQGDDGAESDDERRERPPRGRP